MSSRLLLLRHTLSLIFLVAIADTCLFVAVFLKLFSERWSWSLACWTADWFWGYMQNHWENTLNALPGLTITGDTIPPNEPAVIISNHLSYGDYYFLQALSSRSNMLGKSRFFVKKEIVWQIPLFGIAFWSLGMILVSRNWANDEELIKQAFAHITESRHLAWIVLYPEGTRCTPEKLLKSQAYARQNGKPELQHLLYPRTKGFVSTIKGVRGSHIEYLYDLTFVYTTPSNKLHSVPTLAEQLSCPDLYKAGYRYQIAVKRIPIASLPVSDAELRQWCEDRWHAKDVELDIMLRPDSNGSNGINGVKDIK